MGDRCVNGICTGLEYRMCTDNNPCTRDYCNPDSGCVYKPDNEGQKCDDNNICTKGETCLSGVCTGGDMVCMCATDADCVIFEDGNLCNGILMCDQSRHVCVPDPATVVHCVQPHNLCMQSVCQPATGKCVEHVADNGTICDDFNACTIGDSCVDGQCVGKDACNDGNTCTKDLCNPVNGECIHDSSIMEGISCGNGMTCVSGVCTNVVNAEDVNDIDVMQDIRDLTDINDSEGD